jgi:hypothetical protein
VKEERNPLSRTDTAVLRTRDELAEAIRGLSDPDWGRLRKVAAVYARGPIEVDEGLFPEDFNSWEEHVLRAELQRTKPLLAAPDWSEPGYEAAAEAMRAMVLGKAVTCTLDGSRTHD